MALGLTGVTASVVEYALDGLALRHSAITANIANAHSVGYRPLSVSFEDALVVLVNGGNAGIEAVSQLPRATITEASGGNSASTEQTLETQVVLLNQNVVQHQALISGLNKYLATLAIAINEGRK